MKKIFILISLILSTNTFAITGDERDLGSVHMIQRSFSITKEECTSVLKGAYSSNPAYSHVWSCVVDYSPLFGNAYIFNDAINFRLNKIDTTRDCNMTIRATRQGIKLELKHKSATDTRMINKHVAIACINDFFSASNIESRKFPITLLKVVR